MNDLRLPGLNAPLGPAARADGAARGAADAGEFDAALLRSTQRANPAAATPDLRAARAPDAGAERAPDRSGERAADAALARRRDSDAAARTPREANRPERATARRPERTPDRAADDTAERVAGRREEFGQARTDTRTDPRAPRVDADADAAQGSAPAAEPSSPADAAAAAPASEHTGELAADLAPLVSALTAPAAEPAGVPLPTAAATGEAVAATENAATDDAGGEGPQPSAATGLPARSAAPAPHAAAAKTSADDAAVAAHADTVHTPVKDRLIEDFERRYENALGRAAGAAGGSPLAPSSPLAAAGLPPTLTAAPPAMTVAYASVSTPIGHPAFGQDLSHRILLFAGQHVQSAEISVTPADLGPIRVAIEVRGQEAAMQFSAAHATTRAAIEDALPRLREMLAAQGLQLTQADVGDRSQRGPAFGDRGDARPQPGPGDARSGAAPRLGALGATGTETANVRRVGLIDIRV